MMSRQPEQNGPQTEREMAPLQTQSRGYWSETWRQFRRRRLALVALVFVGLLAAVALCSPAIAGTKPIVCRYRGNLYFPCLGYFNRRWENAIFLRDRFRKIYPQNLQEKDPESWAVWPLIYQDPYRPVREHEWPGRPGNPIGENGKPYVYYLYLKFEDALRGTSRAEQIFGEGPIAINIFGTHKRGIDVFAQMVHGTRIALLVGFVATGIAAAIGISLGACAGYFSDRGRIGSLVDMVVSRLIELMLCIPALVLILALIAVLEKPTIWHMMVVLGVTRWTGIARLTRGEFLKLRESEYVAAALCLGVGQFRIIFRHILPNALAPILVPVVFGIASAILVEAGLSLLGFGAPPPNPSWGNILTSGRQNYEMWWTIVFPGLAIFLTVLAYNLIGEGIQDATDPKLRESSK